jgi:hypothetical protein
LVFARRSAHAKVRVKTIRPVASTEARSLTS